MKLYISLFVALVALLMPNTIWAADPDLKNDYTLVKSMTWGDGINIAGSGSCAYTAYDTGNKRQQTLTILTSPEDAAGWIAMQTWTDGSGKGWWNRTDKGLYCVNAGRSACIFGDDLTAGWLVVFECSQDASNVMTLTNASGEPDGTFSYVTSEDGKSYYCTITAVENAYVGFYGNKNAGFISTISVYKPNHVAVPTTYSVMYVDMEGNILKENVSYNAVAGTTIVLSDADKANFTVGETTYIYDSDDCAEATVAEGGTTVITVKFHAAANFNYTVNEVCGETNARVINGTSYETANIILGYRKYNAVNGQLYKKDATNKQYNYSFKLTQDNQVENITYTIVDGTNNVVFCAEGEDIEGLTPITEGNTTLRSSNSASAFASADTKITTLAAGKYKIHAIIYDCATNPNSDWTFMAGDIQVASFNCTSLNIQEFDSQEFVISCETDLIMLKAGSVSRGLDAIYIVKTGDVADDEAALLNAKEALQTAIAIASNINPEGLADAIAAAQIALRAENATVESLIQATQTLEAAVKAFEEASSLEPVEGISYSWESPVGEPIEWGGTIAYVNGDGDRLNYQNSGYYTICLNGKKANIDDEAPSANAGKMVVTLDKALAEGDTIAYTAYVIKNESKKASPYIVFENGTTAEGEVFSDEANIDATFNGVPTLKYTVVPAEAAGSKTITLTRSQAGTNLFITKLQIIEKTVAEPIGYAVTVAKAENGSVVANPTEAAEGETVTLIATPAEGYMVDEAHVTYGEGQEVELMVNAEANTATFTMPAAAVNVLITFKAGASAEDTEVTLIPSDFEPITSAEFSGSKGDVNVVCTSGTVTADHIRVFKNQTITFSSTKAIKKIVFICTANGDAKYGPGCFNVQDGYTFEADGYTGTWEGSAWSVTFTAATDQVRITQAVITLSDAAVEITHTWDFTRWSKATVANLIADAAASKVAGWSDVEKKADAEADIDPTEAAKDNCFWLTDTEGGELTANGVVIEELRGLRFDASYTARRYMAIAVNYPSTSLGDYAGPAYLWLGGGIQNVDCFVIKNVKAGTQIRMGVESHKATDARGVQLFVQGAEGARGDKLLAPDGSDVAVPTVYEEQTWVVPGVEGVCNVIVCNTKGCHIYFIDAEIGEPVEQDKLGDVNNDSYVNVTDVVTIIDYILERNPKNFNVAMADVNFDGEINVTDIVCVLDVILGRASFARTATRENWNLSDYTAFQMDLTIPAGYVLESVSLTDIAKDGHTLAYNMLADGRCRVVVYSMDKEALPGAWDEVIRLNLRGQGDAQVGIDRATFVTIGGECHELLMNPTSIAQLSNLNSQTSTLYDLQGRKVEKARKGLFIVNGKVVKK